MKTTVIGGRKSNMHNSIRSAEELLHLLNGRIGEMRYGETPRNLYDPIRYIMSLGGKRIRPLLVLLAYQLRGSRVEEVLDPAIAVEVFHNFTLMHDDIMDKAPLRRGRPTVHEQWSETVAILSGDAMLIKAYDLMLKVSRPCLSRVISLFNSTALEVCEGQQIDINFERQPLVSEREYLEMIRLKTAALLGFAMRLGGLLSGSDEADCQKLYEVGERMGIGFQLMDDYLDVYADKTKFGKQVGGDIIANKKTYLLISALEWANEAQRARLNHWLAYKGDHPDEKVSAVKGIYDEIGIPRIAKMKINSYFHRALEALDKVEGSEDAKRLIRTYATLLMKREK